MPADQTLVHETHCTYLGNDMWDCGHMDNLPEGSVCDCHMCHVPPAPPAPPTCQFISRGRYLDSMCGAAITESQQVTDRKRREICAEGHCVTFVTCCGEELQCLNFTNTCGECGADYNSSGQRLADRSQWGEETGETAADILRGDF